MTAKEEALKTRLIDYLFDTDYSIKEISSELGMTKTSMILYLFHGYSVTAKRAVEIDKFLSALGY